MTDEQSAGKIHVDADWKTEAAREKQRLAEQEKQQQQETDGGATPGEATFIELVNLLAMQAAVALGGYQGPGGERIPANPVAARFQIELLEVLQKKTEGNLTEEEARILSAVLHELRMHYVSLVSGKQAPTPPPEKA